MLWQPMNEEELDSRINSLMKRKLKKFPELADKSLNTDNQFGKIQSAPKWHKAIYTIS